MPLSQGNIVDWTDIQSIYNTLNTVRRKFSIATVSVPNYESSLTLPSHVSNLIENITTLSSNKYIGSNATVNTTIPTR